MILSNFKGVKLLKVQIYKVTNNIVISEVAREDANEALLSFLLQENEYKLPSSSSMVDDFLL